MTADSSSQPAPAATDTPASEGGYGELIRLALPLILSNSFWTIQITVDRMFLSWQNPDAVSAATAAVMAFWTPFILFQTTVNFAMTFVAQYSGAKRPQRVGPVIWQAIYFSALVGLLFLLLPWTETITRWMGHSPAIQQQESIYLACLCWMAFPALLTTATSSFFGGLGQSWTVLWINASGTLVNVVLDYLLIFGRAGFPEMGIAGAGWATVIGSLVSAVIGLLLMSRRQFRLTYHTWAGWRFDADLFRRLIRYGVPSGVQWTLDSSAFTMFVMMIGWFGDAEFAASSLTFTINAVAFMPMLGMGQAVLILVGQRLGEDRPALAERTTWIGLKLAAGYMLLMGGLYVLVPHGFIALFENQTDPDKWAAVASMIRVLLWFVAFYSLFDAVYLVFGFALRGAGDTDFVSKVSLCLSWPMMVLPTYLAYQWGASLYWPWAFASGYILIVAGVLVWRFGQGRWKSMRVIEPLAIEPESFAEPPLREADCPTSA